jgi:uncharacterized membrane protein
MAASKSSRARNARSGTQARNGAAGNAGAATALKSGAANRSGGANRNGTAARNGGSARNRTDTGNGTDTRNGKAGGNGQARDGAARSAAAKRGGSRNVDVADDLASGTGPALWLQIATWLLSMVGLGVSIYLTIAHFTESTLAGCSETSGLVDCTKVTTSAQSFVFGIPVAVLGLAFYAFAVVIMSPWAWRAARREVHIVRIASLVVGIGFVLYLLYAELFIIGNICLYCTSVHVITFVIFVLVVIAAATWGFKPGAAWAWPRRPASRSQAAQA